MNFPLKSYRTLLYRTSLFLIIGFFLPGCIAAELGLTGEMGIGAADLAGADALMGETEGALTRSILTANEAGEMSAETLESANSMLSKIRLENGEPPKLYYRGSSEPFAEVYPESGKFKIIKNGKVYSLPDNIFSVKGEIVHVRNGAGLSYDVVSTVTQGDLLIKLGEENGWYQVKVLHNSRVIEGWIYYPYAVAVSRKKTEKFRQPNHENKQVADVKIQRITNFGLYVNHHVGKQTDISIIIVDNDNNYLTSVSSNIANVYAQKGKTSNIGLLKSDFFKYPEFHELRDGSSSIIEKLQIGHYSNYLGVGTINYSFSNSSLVKNQIVCSISLSMNIISLQYKSIFKSFTIDGNNGNGITQEQAREDAFNKLLNNYFTYYSSL